jgi:hypothetical protein
LSAAGAGAAAAAAAAAAAEAARLQREEEEEMTPYSEDDLRDDWEFKILRSTSDTFRRPDELRRVLEEEGRAGWVLVEKFDDQRLRLKRRSDAQAHDYAADFDVYRTYVGRTPQQQGMQVLAWVLGITLLIVGVVAAIALLRR